MKIIKDPVYGYIEIEREFVHGVIDTPYFQRLRNVRQTSYAPLYPSAEHSRFCHSLGVYYLGNMAAEILEEDAETIYEEAQSGAGVLLKDIKRTFLLACLLHDIGHAPFSHTGENFYDTNGGKNLLEKLKTLLNSDSFNMDTDGKKLPKNHELISAIIGLRKFGEIIPAECHDFFVRCITGYKYRGREDCEVSDKEAPLKNEQLLNCYIELLHSSTIDMDRLDYLLRDAYFTGHHGITIDYIRLLKGLCLHKDSKGLVRVAFTRVSLSIIENVIYAHDSERKWIRSHPIVLYGQFVAGTIIRKVNDYFKEATGVELFCEERLLSLQDSDGLGNGSLKINYLFDDDILFIAKNYLNDSSFSDYFNRNQWRHPIWKSEAEYRHLLAEKNVLKEKLAQALGDLSNDLNKPNISGVVISDEFITECEEQLKELNADIDGINKKEQEKQRKFSLQKYERKKEWAEYFKEFCDKKGIKFNIVIISADVFQSGFSERDFGDIQIRMSKETRTVSLAKTLPHLFGENRRQLDQEEKSLFYIFYDRTRADSEGLETISAKEFIDFIETKCVD